MSPPSWRGSWLATPWTSSSSRRSNGWAAGSLGTNIHTTHSKIGCYLMEKFDHIPPRFVRCNFLHAWKLTKNLRTCEFISERISPAIIVSTVLPLSLNAPIEVSVSLTQNVSIIIIDFIITIVTTLIIIITQLKQDLLLFLTRAVTSWQSMAPPIQTQSGQVSTNACAAAVSYSCLIVLPGFGGATSDGKQPWLRNPNTNSGLPTQGRDLTLLCFKGMPWVG